MSVVELSTGLGRSRVRRTVIALAAAGATCLFLAFAAGAKAAPTSGNFTQSGINVIPAGALNTPPTTTGRANPYPSDITVRNLYPHITRVTVTLESLSHSFPADLDILLTGPQGTSVLLMSDAGNGFNINNVRLGFDDAAPTLLPLAAPITSGTYRPTNYGAGDTFPSPAPPPPYATQLGGATGAFPGSNPNGVWHLFIFDDSGADVGQLIGWTLHIEAGPNGGTCTNRITGTSGADTLNGAQGGDNIRGLGGDDVLRGDGGRDCISGSSGQDRISGGPNNDRISGGTGNDSLSGNSGNDRINSVDGTRDRVNCGSGRHDRARVDRIDRVRNCEIVRRVG
jgi:RTX calcium-binding nonapeptide repeat (4 copies)